jgi:chromosome segregation ATPase
MAATVEERIKEMETARRDIEPAWAKAIAKFQKDIAAPAFKKVGDIDALALQFDGVQTKFEGTRNMRDDAGDFIDEGYKEFMKFGNQIGNLQDKVGTLFDSARASVKSGSGSKKLEYRLNSWDELLKEHRDLSGETKNFFDQIVKLQADRVKMISDTSNKVHAEMTSGDKRLAAYNAELNKLEDLIRSTAVKYQKTANDMNRSDIADAVRGFLKAFGN